jgi:hypothetical protein
MVKKKQNEFREKQYNRNTEGLKQRRLKNESRWKFNPNASYESEEDDILDDEEFYTDAHEYVGKKYQ